MMHYWLFKSEPDCFSWQDLAEAPQQTTSWDGVRNYQARNFMKAMQTDDLGFFYHSGADPAIIGVVRIVREAYPDHTAQDPENNHFDPRATPEKPIWEMVDVRLERAFPRPLRRKELAAFPELAGMELLRRGSRLSVQPVSPEAFAFICALADAGEADARG